MGITHQMRRGPERVSVRPTKKKIRATRAVGRFRARRHRGAANTEEGKTGTETGMEQGKFKKKQLGNAGRQPCGQEKNARERTPVFGRRMSSKKSLEKTKNLKIQETKSFNSTRRKGFNRQERGARYTREKRQTGVERSASTAGGGPCTTEELSRGRDGEEVSQAKIFAQKNGRKKSRAKEAL